jgi:hypothetical protein
MSFATALFAFLGNIFTRQEALTRRRRRLVPLGYFRPFSRLGQQLEGGLKVVHVQPRGREQLVQYGRCHRALQSSVVSAVKKYVLGGEKLHGDDVPVPVLEPGHGKTKTGRLWTYVRDDRPAGSQAAVAVWFVYSPDRKGEHPAGHLLNYSGILQADGYAGFNKLYETGRIIEAACWAYYPDSGVIRSSFSEYQ